MIKRDQPYIRQLFVGINNRHGESAALSEQPQL